jgi:hypothetical protein
MGNLTCIRIKPEEGLVTRELHSASKVSALKLLQLACLCLGPFRVWKGLGEPFGKASLANTAFGLGRFISTREQGCWGGEGWFRHPSEAWPDEALERGLPRALAKKGKNWGWARKFRPLQGFRRPVVANPDRIDS